jgi:hypothetical protein
MYFRFCLCFLFFVFIDQITKKKGLYKTIKQPEIIATTSMFTHNIQPMSQLSALFERAKLTDHSEDFDVIEASGLVWAFKPTQIGLTDFMKDVPVHYNPSNEFAAGWRTGPEIVPMEKRIETWSRFLQMFQTLDVGENGVDFVHPRVVQHVREVSCEVHYLRLNESIPRSSARDDDIHNYLAFTSFTYTPSSDRSNDAFDCEQASRILSIIKPDFAERLRFLFRAAVLNNPFECSLERDTTISPKQVLIWSRIALVKKSVFSRTACEKYENRRDASADVLDELVSFMAYVNLNDRKLMGRVDNQRRHFWKKECKTSSVDEDVANVVQRDDSGTDLPVCVIPNVLVHLPVDTDEDMNVRFKYDLEAVGGPIFAIQSLCDLGAWWPRSAYIAGGIVAPCHYNRTASKMADVDIFICTDSDTDAIGSVNTILEKLTEAEYTIHTLNGCGGSIIVAEKVRTVYMFEGKVRGVHMRNVHPGTHRIQLIRSNHNNPEDLVKDFDLPFCEAFYSPIEDKISLTVDAMMCWKNMAVKNVSRNFSDTRSIRIDRIVKAVDKGYDVSTFPANRVSGYRPEKRQSTMDIVETYRKTVQMFNVVPTQFKEIIESNAVSSFDRMNIHDYSGKTSIKTEIDTLHTLLGSNHAKSNSVSSVDRINSNDYHGKPSIKTYIDTLHTLLGSNAVSSVDRMNSNDYHVKTSIKTEIDTDTDETLQRVSGKDTSKDCGVSISPDDGWSLLDCEEEKQARGDLRNNQRILTTSCVSEIISSIYRAQQALEAFKQNIFDSRDTINHLLDREPTRFNFETELNLLKSVAVKGPMKVYESPF